MKKLICLSFLTVFITSCAQSGKVEKSNPEPEMKKVSAQDLTKDMSKKNFKAAKLQKEDTPQSILTCTAGSDVRVLEIKPVDGKGCELQYTKNGKTKTVANANFDLKYCESVQTRISKKLEAAGFDCQ